MLAKRAERIDNKTKGTTLYKVLDWITLLPTLLSLLGLCKPKNPEPVNPTQSPTPAQSAAWSKAWAAKSAGTDNWDKSDGTYSPKTIQRTANRIRKEKRRDGKRITKDEAQDAAILALDEGRLSSMTDLYADVLEATHAV